MERLDQHDYDAALAQQIDAVFRARPDIADHRAVHPGITGSLGDPFAPVWFLEEAPSRGRGELHGPPVTNPEAQWNGSPADRLFRSALGEAGLLAGPPERPGGWRCCVTSLIKAVAKDGGRGGPKPLRTRMAEAEAWAPVLRWQLETGAPQWLVLKGAAVADLFRHLVNLAAVPLPPHIERIERCTYVAARLQGSEGRSAREIAAAYRRSIAAIARLAGIAPG